MDINKFDFIYLPIMDEFHPIIYLFNPNHEWGEYSQQIQLFSFCFGQKSLLGRLTRSNLSSQTLKQTKT
jgi:hypothetical protein